MLAITYLSQCFLRNTCLHMCACTQTCVRACMHTHTHAKGKRVCVCVCVCAFSIFQLYMTQNFTDTELNNVSQKNYELQLQDVETSHTTSQCTTQYYQVVLNPQFHISSDSNYASLAGWMQDRNVYTNWLYDLKMLPSNCHTYRKRFPRASLSYPYHVMTTHGNRPALALDSCWCFKSRLPAKCKDMHSHWCGMPENT